MRKFSKEHEWLEVQGDVATVGITEYAQAQLGDVVFVELPEVGKKVTQGGDAAVVESVKAASEVYAPLDGEVTEINQALLEDSALVNTAAETTAWFFKMKIANSSQLEDLMDAAAYAEYIKGL